MMGMALVGVIVSITFRLAATTGMFFSAVRVFVVSLMFVLAFAAAAISAGFGGPGLRQKFLPAMFAAKEKRLPVAFGMKRCRFVHLHSANGVFSHSSILFLGRCVAVTLKAAMLGAQVTGLFELLPQLLPGTVRSDGQIVPGNLVLSRLAARPRGHECGSLAVQIHAAQGQEVSPGYLSISCCQRGGLTNLIRPALGLNRHENVSPGCRLLSARSRE